MALKKEGLSSFSAVALTMLAFYFIIFHYLANLPLDRPLFFGVHIRFWMQSHLIVFGFIGIGIERLLSWLPSVCGVRLSLSLLCVSLLVCVVRLSLCVCCASLSRSLSCVSLPPSLPPSLCSACVIALPPSLPFSVECASLDLAAPFFQQTGCALSDVCVCGVGERVCVCACALAYTIAY